MPLKLALLRKLENKSQKQADYYSNEINKRELQRELPKLKKKYEGKYFKYNNGYSAEDRWWKYIFCSTVIGMSKLSITAFENCLHGDNIFEINKEVGAWVCEKEITKSEYDKALKKFLSLTEKLSQ